MEMFKTSNDVEEWLEPMNYEEFWIAIKPWCLVLPTRQRCDQSLADGADLDDVLGGLKVLAGYLLAARHSLPLRPVGPVLRVVSSQY